MAAVGGSSKPDAMAPHPKLVDVPAGAVSGLLDFRVLAAAIPAYVRYMTYVVRGGDASSRHSHWYAQSGRRGEHAHPKSTQSFPSARSAVVADCFQRLSTLHGALLNLLSPQP
jgi:hypothetical protein